MDIAGSSLAGTIETKRPTRKKWFVILGGIILMVVVGIYSFAQILQAHSREAFWLTQELHEQMADGAFDSIYDAADDGFKKIVTRDQSLALFSGVVRKMGTPGICKQGGTFMGAGTSGTTLKTYCETMFSTNAKGTEMFLWRKVNGGYRLLGYNVTSNALLK